MNKRDLRTILRTMRPESASQPGRVPGGWGLVLLWVLGSALISVFLLWKLIPSTPDPFSTAASALRTGTTSVARPVFGDFATASPQPSYPQNSRSPQRSSPSPQLNSPSARLNSPNSRKQQPPSRRPQPATRLPTVHAVRPNPAFPTAEIGNAVAQAYRFSPTIAVEIATDHRFAVAPVTGPFSSPIPASALLAAALISAVAGLGGALIGRRMSGRELAPILGADQPTAVPPEPEASRELQRLRRSAQQRTALARSLAELLPSMPDALVWQAEKALADVGVRPVVADGELFDPAAHDAIGVEPVPRGKKQNTVARTVRPGYADDERILVYPKVVVYANDDGQAP